MKRIAYAFGIALEIALVAGMFVLDRFSHAKLGMNRWLVFHNRKWAQELPLDAIEMLAIAVVAVVLVAAAVKLARQPRKRVAACLSVAVLALMACAFAWFVAVCSPADVHAYLLMALCLFVACLLQAAQAFSLCKR